jgi:hypothetical protein
VVKPPARDVFQMISNSLAMLIVLYVIYVLPLLASTEQDQIYRYRLSANPRHDTYQF